MVIARLALTLRLSPANGCDAEMRAALRALIEKLPIQPGLAGMHMLRHQVPPIAPTEEQKMHRHADRVADWVLVVHRLQGRVPAGPFGRRPSTPRVVNSGFAYFGAPAPPCVPLCVFQPIVDGISG